MRFFLLLSLTGPKGSTTDRYCGFITFKEKIFQYVVLLQDNKNMFKGTGYIVAADTLITPSGNLKDYNEFIKFTSKTNLGEGERTIRANRTYNKFLSVALVSCSMPILCNPRITTTRKKFL